MCTELGVRSSGLYHCLPTESQCYLGPVPSLCFVHLLLLVAMPALLADKIPVVDTPALRPASLINEGPFLRGAG